MRRDDRQVIVIKTTVGNDGADCKVLSRYLPSTRIVKKYHYRVNYSNQR